MASGCLASAHPARSRFPVCLLGRPSRWSFERRSSSRRALVLAAAWLVLCLARPWAFPWTTQDSGFVFGGRREEVQPEDDSSNWFEKTWEKLRTEVPLMAATAWREHRSEAIGLPVCVLCAIGLAALYVERAIRQARQLQRPYAIRDVGQGIESLQNPMAEFIGVMTYIQDTIVAPIDERLPGRPFEYDLHSFPFTPMVLIIGNHSSGKSTFINQLMGVQVQETGVAPTDDGFTILERHPGGGEMEDGPTVLGCPENRPFRELQRFGQAFSGHLRRKRVHLPEDTHMPFGLQIIDTPGMIDLPANTESSAKGRGYNFVEVVRWWAKRADLVLLLFDPDKPGTTGETLDVLTKSLHGLDHKFLVVLNKVDQLDNTVDFARAYGALGWALSKVINRKDIPQIYTMYNNGFGAQSDRVLPLEAFAKKRQEVIDEVLRAKSRHNDNLVTQLEELLRQIQMVSIVVGALRSKSRRRMVAAYSSIFVLLGTPVLTILRFVMTGRLHIVFAWWQWALSLSCYALIGLGLVSLAVEYMKQFDKLQAASLDETFEEVYSSYFIHDDGEDYRLRWEVVRPKITSILSAASSGARLPAIAMWEATRIGEVLHKDIWYLRQLARILRTGNGVTEVTNGKKREVMQVTKGFEHRGNAGARYAR